MITSSVQEDAESPKEVVQVNWQHLVEEPVLWFFNHHLRKNFLRTLGDVADINLERTMSKASIAEAVFKSCDQKVTVPVGAARTRWVDICVSHYLATVGKFTF